MSAPTQHRRGAVYSIALFIVVFAAPVFALLTGLTTPTATSQSAPTFSSATVEGSQLTISFSSDLDPNSYAAAADFTVLHGETMQAVQSVTVSTDHVLLILQVPIPDVECTTEAVTMSYSATSSTLAGSDGTAVAAFSEASVTNETDAPPEIVSLETDSTGRYIYVTFCEDIADLSYQWADFSAFSVVIDGDAIDVNDLLRRSDTPSRLDISLPSDPAIKEGHQVTVAYDQDQGDENYPLQDDNQGNKLVSNWSSRMVTNNVDSPPTLTAVSSLYENVTMTFNEALDESSTPDPSAFEFGGIQSPPQVQQVGVSDNHVLLTLDGILDNRHSTTYTLSYLIPNERPLRETDKSHDVEDIFDYSFSSSTPTAMPAPVSAEVDGATLTIEFNLPLKAVAAGSTFEVSGVSGLTVVSTSFSGSSLTLTLSEAAGASDSITVSYARPESPPRIEGRNNQDAASFNAYAVENVTSAPAPQLNMSTVSANGASLTLTFSVPLDQSDQGLPELTAFSLSGTDATIESLSILDSTATLVLNPAADVGETILLSYVAPGDATKPRLRSATHVVPVAQISGASVVNHADGKPRVVSAAVTGATLSIGFDRLLDADSTPAADAFTLGGTTSTVSDAAIDGHVLTLTIVPAATHEDAITVSYTKPSASPLKRSGQGIFADSFSGHAVSNGTEDPTPIFQSASVDASGRSLTIVMSNPLLDTAAGIPALDAFSVGGTTGATVESVEMDGSNIWLSLSPAADLNESLDVSYVVPINQSAPALQSADGHWRSPAWTNESVANHADGVPRLVAGVGNADSIVLEFDRNLDDSLTPEPGAFSVTPSNLTVSTVNIDGRTVTLILNGTLAHDDEVTVSYSATGMTLLTREGHTLTVEAFTAATVTNETPPPPLVLSAVGNGRTIVVSLSVSLDESKIPGVDAFSVSPGELNVSDVSILGMTVTLTLDGSLREGIEYTVSYAATNSILLTTDDGEELSAFSEAMTNDTDTAPVATSATGDGSTVTITFDQSLDAQSAIALDSFEVSADGEVSVAGVAHGDRALLVTLSRPLLEDESTTVTYTAPDEDGIVDATGNQSASFSLSVLNQTDTSPIPLSGTVEDDVIVLVLDQDLYYDPRFDLDDGYPTDHFSLNGTDAAIAFVLVSNDGPEGVGRVVITLSQAVGVCDNLTITYFPVSGSIRIRDDDAMQNRAQINQLPLTNLTKRPLEIISAIVDGSTLQVVFCATLDPGVLPSTSAFSLTNGPPVASISIREATLTLMLTQSVNEDESITLTYTTPETNALQDLQGNTLAMFVQEVSNETDYAPSPIQITTNENGQELTVEFDQRLDASPKIDRSWFSLEPAHPVISAELVSDIGDQQRLIVRLEPGSEIREGESVSLVYSPPPSGGLQDDDAPNAVLGFTMTVHNAVDVAPAFEAATVNRHVLEVEFDQPLHPDHVPPPNCEALEEQVEGFDCDEHPDVSWFVVQRNDADLVRIESVAVSGSKVILHLAERATPADQLVVVYSAESLLGGNFNLRDTSSPANQVETIDPMPVTNLTAAAPLAGALDRAQPEELLVAFDADLGTSSDLEVASLQVVADSELHDIEQASTSEQQMMLRLTTAIPECSAVSLSHDPTELALHDASGKEISAFSLDVPNLIESTWGLRCVHSDFGGLDLTFADGIETVTAPEHQWSLLVNGAERKLDISASGDIVELRPFPAACTGDLVTVRLAGAGEAQSLLVERVVHLAAPCVMSAEANGVSLLVTFDGPLDADLPDSSQFTISGDASIEAVTGIDGATLSLRLAAPGLRAEQEAKLTYEGTSLRGLGLTAAPFDIDVVDVTAPPQLVSAFAVGSAVFLKFDQTLLQQQISGSRFTPVGPGIDVTALSVNVNGDSLYLELSDDLPDDLELFGLVYWSRVRGGLAGLTGSRVPDAVFVARNFTETAPAVTSVVTDSSEIELTFNQRVDGTKALMSDFSVTAGRRMIAVTSLEWSSSGVVLALAERVTSLDAVALSYAPGEAGSVQDSSGIALAEFRIWATNVTALPKSLEQRVADARLRSSSGETTFARELARGFAGQQGIGVVVEGGTGWTTVVRGGLRLSIDSERLGDEPTRVHAFPIEGVKGMLEQIATIPASCMSGDDASEIRAWWIGVSDVEGVPSNLGARVVVSGEDFGGFWATYCVLDLISGEWQFARQDADFVGPALILRRDIQLRPTEDLWSLVG